MNLALLLKHGVYTVANKMANGQNIVAVDDAWTAFKLDNVKPPKPNEAPELPKTKTKTKVPSKGGPGVNQPIDEFDDAAIYQGAGKSRTEPSSATGGKVEGTGKDTLDVNKKFPTRSIDMDTEGYIIDRVAELKQRLSNGALNKGGANFGYMEVEVDVPNIKTEFYAHSQVNGPPNPDIKGRIKLFTENDTCASCNDIIYNFTKDYPGIKVEVIHNNALALHKCSLNLHNFL